MKYSKEYEEAKKEFINCLLMGLVGCGVPYVLAFKEWWPIMRREKKKALEQKTAAGSTEHGNSTKSV